MAYLKRLWNWFKRPWPLHVFPLLICGHLTAMNYFSDHKETINLWSSIGFQIVGGLLVLYAINSNLNLISKSSIKNSVINWIKSFPLKSKSINPNLQGSIQVNTSSSGKISITPEMDTIEKKVEYLFQEIKRVDKEKQEIRKEFSELVNQSEMKLKELEKIYSTKINEIQMKLNEVVVGGAKEEFLGVILVIYGLVITTL